MVMRNENCACSNLMQVLKYYIYGLFEVLADQLVNVCLPVSLSTNAEKPNCQNTRTDQILQDHTFQAVYLPIFMYSTSLSFVFCSCLQDCYFIVGSVINGRHCKFLCRDTDCWCAAGRGAALGRGDSSCQELLFRHDTSPPFQHAAYQHLHHLQNSSHFSCLPLGPYLMLMHKNVTRTEFYH